MIKHFDGNSLLVSVKLSSHACSTLPRRDRVESNRQDAVIITIEIPEELACQLIAAGQDPARATLEAVALEGYRRDRLSEADIRQLLGFETRMEVHGFLKEQGVFLHYTDEDLAHDREVAIQVARRARAERQGDPSDQRRAG
jgi:hypothetical protein